MRRFFSVAVPTLAVAVVFLLGTFSAGGPADEGRPAAEPPPRRPGAADRSLPGLWGLDVEDVQKELALTDQQKEKLRAIGRKYYEEARRDWTGFRGMSAEERKKKYAEIRQENIKRTKDVRKQVEEVLSAEQLDRLRQITLRTRVLANPGVFDQLGINEAQQKRLSQILEQMQERIRSLHQETLEKTLEVLTPQQRKKLEELTTEGFGT